MTSSDVTSAVSAAESTKEEKCEDEWKQLWTGSFIRSLEIATIFVIQASPIFQHTYSMATDRYLGSVNNCHSESMDCHAYLLQSYRAIWMLIAMYVQGRKVLGPTERT